MIDQSVSAAAPAESFAVASAAAADAEVEMSSAFVALHSPERAEQLAACQPFVGVLHLSVVAVASAFAASFVARPLAAAGELLAVAGSSIVAAAVVAFAASSELAAGASVVAWELAAAAASSELEAAFAAVAWAFVVAAFVGLAGSVASAAVALVQRQEPPHC